MAARMLAAGIVVVVLVARPVLGEASRAEVESLFAAATKVSASSLAAARDVYEQIDRGGRRGPLSDYAFALVLMEQQQWKEAAGLLETLAKSAPKALPPRRALIWVQLARKDYQTALVGLEALAAALPASKEAALTTDQREAAQFVGAGIAFLKGPAASARIDKLVKAASDRINERLNPQLRPDLEAGSAATNEQFQKLQTATASAKDEAAAQQADAIAAEKEQLNEAQTAVEDARSELEARADQRKQKTEADLDQVNAQLSELREDHSRVIAAGAPFQAQINAAQAEIAGLTQTVQQPDGSTTIEYIDPARVHYLEHAIGGLQARLAPLQAELNAINFRVEGLRNQYGALLRQHNVDLNRMFGEGQQLAKSKSRLDRMEKNNARAKVTGRSTRTRVLSAKAATFSTYEPFPMASEKQRVLDLLK